MGFFDIYHSLKTKIGFQSQVHAIVRDLQTLERRNPTAKVQKEKKSRLLELLRISDFNSGLLVPYFFPRYPDNKPLALSRRPFAFAMYAVIVGGFLVLRGSRQISKSTSFAGRQLINAHMLPNWGSMHITPHTEHRSTYATRLREMEMACRFYKPRSELRQNLFFKEFISGSKIELVRALTSAAHIRGKSTDELLYDEYQLFDPELEGEIDQTIKASKAKVRIYAGTSTTIDSPLEDRYLQSSCGTWKVRGSKGWIDFGDRDQVLKMIRPEGLRDPWDKTRMVDVMSGQWSHAYAEKLEMNRIGFHVPQLIIPDFVYKFDQWSDIYRAFIEYDTKLFVQEVLGIPIEEGSREITQKDLERICVLGQRDELQKAAQANRNKYKFVVSGFDWGGSDHQQATNIKTSFTAHVILGITYQGTFDILWMRRHTGMGYREIIAEILKAHFAFGGTAIASDHGGGVVYNQVLREDPRVDLDRHLVLNYSGPNTAVFAAPHNPDTMYNQWTVNKTESLSSLFEAIKRPELKIRCYDWGDARDYLMDFLNSFRVVSETQHGARYFKYIRPPSKSDDIMQAMNFAHVVGKIMMGEPLVHDPGLARELERRLRTPVYTPRSHSPGMRVFSGNVVAG